uniref:AcylCoA desaturase 1 putative n=1 Tax=Albugo laibachii Nc14 TaxID=890382 RepID=F0W7Y9_9STRA|nr:acylCoA desaturase 1 putative [Albugo laibachii Nc14]|eukprot:CCA17242.1 acylCoA desaturase 1 putative [Albugo laibachii Nc14]
MSFQGSIFTWSRDHRVHHKESDSDGDPHNASRGFFFAHIGWIMVRKHPNVLLAGKKLNHDDLLKDPIVSFQSRYYLLTALVICYGIPMYTGHLLGSMMNGFWVGAVFRHVWVLHMTWCVNSVAHFFGYRPYNENSRARENVFVSICAIGEGYHNYHHKYPFDYATSEGGIFFGQWNPTKCFIDFCALMGWAYDLKRSRSAAAVREQHYVKRSSEVEGSSKIPLRKLFQGMLSRIYLGKRSF